MEHRTLGTSDLSVSVVGLGCNNLGRPGTLTFEQDGATAVVHAALDAGVTFFDTADVYGAEYGLSETLLGAALRGRRDEAVVATKFGHQEIDSPMKHLGSGGSRAYIRAAVEGSLERLGVETIDLYQIHTPDPHTPVEETLDALDELVREGKVREIGNSNFTAAQLREADAASVAAGSARFVSAQNQYNLLERAVEDDVLPAVRDLGMGFLPFFPLANGLFTGKFSRTEVPADSRIARQRPHVAADAPWDAIEEMERFAAARGVGGNLRVVPGPTRAVECHRRGDAARADPCQRCRRRGLAPRRRRDTLHQRAFRLGPLDGCVSPGGGQRPG